MEAAKQQGVFPEHVTAIIKEIPEENYTPVLEIPDNYENTTSLNSKSEISDEVGDADEGVTFMIASGEYGEKIKIEQDCNLIGSEDVQITSSQSAPIVTVISGNTIITSITFEQDEDSNPAILLQGGNARFEKCTFKSSAEKASTVIVENNANAYFKDCKFLGSSDSPAIECSGDSIVFCEDCQFEDSEDDLISLNGNCTFYLTNGSLTKAKSTAISINEHSHSILKSTKFTNCEYGINISSDSTSNIFRSLTFEDIEENCLVMTSQSNAQIHGSTFRSSKKPAIKCKKESKLLFLQNRIIPGRWKGISLFDESRIECSDGDIGGYVNIRSESVFVGMHTNFHTAGIHLAGTGDLQCHNCTLQSIENGRPAIEAEEESTLLLIGTQITQTGGIRLRTTKRVHLLRSSLQNCTTGIDIGGGNVLQITNCQIENSTGYGLFAHSATFSISNSIISQNNLIGVQLVNSIATLNRNHVIQNIKGGICANENSSLTLNEGMVNENSEFAILLKDSFVKIHKAKLENNVKCGVIASNSRAKISEVDFNHNQGTACQFEGEKTKGLIVRSNFIQNGTGIINSDSSELSIDNCTFSENGVHIEGKLKSKSCITNKTVLSRSKEGVGIFIHNDACATISNCNLNNEAKTAIATSSATNVKNTTIEKCGNTGVTFMEGSSGIIEHCNINFNNKAGINVSSPSVTIVDNTIKNNGKYGIAMKKDVKCDLGQNVLENNVTPYYVY